MAKKILKWGIPALLVAAIGIYLWVYVDWKPIERLHFFDVLVLFFSTLVLLLLHSSGATILLWGLGYRTSIWLVFSSMMASSTISVTGDPKLGVPARLAFYRMLAGVPIAVGTAQTAIETLIWLMLLGVMLMISGVFKGTQDIFLATIAAGAVLFMGLLVLFGPRLLDRMWIVGPLFKASGPVRKFVYEVRAYILQITPLSMVLSTLCFGSTYIVDIASIWYLGHALGTDLTFAGIANAIVGGYVAGTASMLPLGLGVRDIAFALLLEQAGSPHDTAAIIAVIHRAIRTVLPLLIGLALVIIIPRLKFRRVPVENDS